MTDAPRPAHHLPPEALTGWADAVAELYGLADRFTAADVAEVLDVARDVSKGVNRPAAPVSTFVLGLALGRALAPDAAPAELTALLARLGREVRDAALAVPADESEATP